MEINEAIKKLNVETEKVYAGKVARADFAYFYCGDAKEKLKEVLSVAAPFGKAVLLYTEKTFMQEGVAFTETIKAAGCKPYNVVTSADFDIVKAAGALLRAPEDTRVIITVDYSLIPLASYTAKLAGVPLVYIMRDFCFEGLLSPRVYLQNGGFADYFKTAQKRHVIIDFNAVLRGGNAGEAYVALMSNLPALADYRAACAVKREKTDRAAYSLARTAFVSALSLFSFPEEERKETLLYNCLLSEIANAACGGKLFDFSAVRCAERLLCGEKRCSPQTRFKLFSGVCGIYYLYCCGEYEKILSFPDYSARAQAIARETGLNEGQFVSGLKKQLAVLNKNENIAQTLKERLKDEIKGYNSAVNKIRSAYYVLGGKSNENAEFGLGNIAAALKLCGDFPAGINLMTLVREEGITENL